MGKICLQAKRSSRRGGPHELDPGDENARACLKYSEWTRLSEVEGLGRRIRGKFL